MKNLCLLTFVVLVTAACSTPKVMLKNEKTGQVVSCGGSATGSLVGGVIGYHIQKSNDSQCEADYLANGFDRITPPPTPVANKAPTSVKKTSNINAAN